MCEFTELTIAFKSRGINLGFHIMDNKALTAVKMVITTMDINYQLVPPINHRAKNVEI